MDYAQIVNSLRTLVEESIVIPPQSEEQTNYLIEDFVKRLVFRADRHPEVAAFSVAVVVDQLVAKKIYLYLENDKLTARPYPIDLTQLSDYYLDLIGRLLGQVNNPNLDSLERQVQELSQKFYMRGINKASEELAQLRRLRLEYSKAREEDKLRKKEARQQLRDHFYQFLLKDINLKPTEANKRLFNAFWDSESSYEDIYRTFKVLADDSKE